MARAEQRGAASTGGAADMEAIEVTNVSVELQVQAAGPDQYAVLDMGAVVWVPVKDPARDFNFKLPPAIAMNKVPAKTRSVTAGLR